MHDGTYVGGAVLTVRVPYASSCISGLLSSLIAILSMPLHGRNVVTNAAGSSSGFHDANIRRN
jgi:hypothetical protein